jgi:VWFA-related protein
LLSLAASLGFAAFAQQPAQQPAKPPPATPPSQQTQGQRQDGRIRSVVDLVVLHATVVDTQGRMVTDLKREQFRVFENKVEQELSIFRHENIALTLGLVIDNSGSMKDKRDKVNSAALTFVRTSGREDEVFVVNFNEDYFLDLEKDFTNNLDELKEALERVDSRGSTALYDAVVGSLDHLKKGTKDKKVLLVITDGDDNASRGDPKTALQRAMIEAQKSEAVIYVVGLFTSEERRKLRKARRDLTDLAQSSGGLAFFPETLDEVEPVCTQIASDIRNQYTLAYYPTNAARDGSFRAINVDVKPARGRSKLTVRTRSGYYAARDTTGDQ